MQLSFVNTAVGDPLMTWKRLPEAGGELQAVKVASLPSMGTLRNNGLAVTVGQLVSADDIAAGRLRFTPAPNFAGATAGFTFQVQTGSGLDPTVVGLQIDVNSVNDPPAGLDKTISMPRGTTYTFVPSDFAFNDSSDVPVNLLSAIRIASLPTAGLLTCNNAGVTLGQVISLTSINSGQVKFTPFVNGSGAGYATFTFQVQDSGGTANGGINLDPTANSITIDIVDTVTDTTAPTVSAFSPAGGSTGVAIGTAVQITFTEAMSAASINTSTVQLLNGGTPVAASLSYNNATRVVTLTPSASLANGTTYSILVKGGATGVKDLAGNPLSADVQSSFTTVAATPVTTSSLWNGSATPSQIDSGDAQSIELGTRFIANTNGTITGLRFYKSAANTGVHTASLWNAAGQRLATATFSGESASGWQQVNFATPVAIVAGATYTASYHTDTGRYSVSRSYFASQFNSGPLRVPAGGGVYRYGASAFPTQSYQSSNYWVDVVFSATSVTDTTAPTVSAFSPAGGSTGVAIGTAVQITFSEAMSAASINTSTVQLLNGGTPVAASLSYNNATRVVTLTPSAPLANGTTYSILVKGGATGVKDLAGNPLSADVQSSFTTVAATPVTTSSLWNGSATPSQIDSGDAQSIELGTRFIANTNGTITGLRFYKSAANTGVHTASLWNAAGQRLATATFSGESASGWQQVNFATPVAIVAGATYTASYHTDTGRYSVSRSYFASQFNSGPLRVPAGGGVYRYGAVPSQPSPINQATTGSTRFSRRVPDLEHSTGIARPGPNFARSNLLRSLVRRIARSFAVAFSWLPSQLRCPRGSGIRATQHYW